MARMEPRPEERAGLFVRFAYWMARRRLGKVPVPIGIMAHSRWILAASAGYELALERAGRADARLKQLAVLRTAMMIGCRFCIDIGAALAPRSGVTEEELRDLVDPEASGRFSELDKRVIRYAEAMSGCPMVVPEGLFASLLAVLGPEAMVELTAAIAWENHRARFNHAFGATEEGYSDRAVCLLPVLEETHAG
jgi:AhpD family alkylhydroperoxidase